MQVHTRATLHVDARIHCTSPKTSSATPHFVWFYEYSIRQFHWTIENGGVLAKLGMYCSNSNNPSILRRSHTSYTSSHELSRTKMVHIGKHKHPVTIMVMVPITAPAWQKKSCFDTLRKNVYHLSNGGHKMADIC